MHALREIDTEIPNQASSLFPPPEMHALRALCKYLPGKMHFT